MAIQQRRGANADFDSTKMLPGELAVTTDGSRKVYVAFAPGDVKELASAEEVKESVQNGIEEIEQKKKEVLAEIPDYEERLAELEIYKANSIITTSSGEVIYETDCAAVSPVNIKLFGKGKHDTVPGNQLFDANRITTTIKNGITVTNNGDGSFTISADDESNITDGTLAYYNLTHEETISLLKQGALNLDCVNSSNPYLTIHLKSSTSTLLELGNYNEGVSTNIITQEMLENEDLYLRIVFYYNNSMNMTFTNNVTIKPMLYQDGDGTWEPYVGGVASPNMNYSQIPEFLGESGSIESKLMGKNRWDSEYASVSDNWKKCTVQDWYWYMPIPVQKDDKVTVSYKDGLETGLYMNCALSYSNEGVIKVAKWLYNSNTASLCVNEVTITSEQDELYLVFYSDTSLNSVDVDLFAETIGNELQIEINESKTAYDSTPHQRFTALTPNGLRGIPLGTTIPDAIANSPIHMSGVYWDSVEEQYYIADTENEDGKDVQRVNKYTLTEEDKGYIYMTESTNGNTFTLAAATINKLIPIINCNDGAIVMSNVARSVSFLERGNKEFISVYCGNGSGLYFRDRLKNTLTIEEVRNADITIWYVMAEPITTDLTDEELAEYNALVMNYPNTTIVNAAGAYMEVTHVKDTQKHIEQNYVSKAMHEEHESRIAELEKAIVNS